MGKENYRSKFEKLKKPLDWAAVKETQSDRGPRLRAKLEKVAENDPVVKAARAEAARARVQAAKDRAMLEAHLAFADAEYARVQAIPRDIVAALMADMEWRLAAINSLIVGR